ncbi:MAG: class I SAM-dependent methyltransferase [Nanoarchaeota archaeon]
MSDLSKKLFANILASKGQNLEKKLEPFKKQIFNNFKGKTILEIGAGTGINLRYYKGAKMVYLLEPNEHMHKHILDRNKSIKIKIKILKESAEKIFLPNNSIDVVVSSFVLCSVKNVPKVIKEISRVLKSSGEFIFIEHVASKKGLSKVIQIIIRKPWSYIADGCDCHRDTEETIRKSKLFKKIKLKEIKKVPTFFIRPWIIGSAKK